MLDKIKQNEIKANILLGKIRVVLIDIGPQEDEQRIFDTINSLGVSLTTAELMKNFLFKDDILLHNCVSEMVDIIETKKIIGLVALKKAIKIENLNDSKNNWIELYGDLQKTLNFNTDNAFNLIDKRLIKSNAFFSEPINKIGEPSVVLFRRSIIKEIGLFNEDLNQMLDFEFYYRILKFKKIAIIKEKLAVFRLHKDQLTNINIKSGLIVKDFLLYEKLIYKNIIIL